MPYAGDNGADVADNSYDEEQASVVGTVLSCDVLAVEPCRTDAYGEASASMDTYEHDEAVEASGTVLELYSPCEKGHRSQLASMYYSFGVGCSSFPPL